MKNIERYAWEESNREIARRYGLDELEIIRFDQNTVPSAQRKLRVALNEYPDPSYSTLTKAIARYANAEKDQITVGAGADEIIDDVFKAFVEPEDCVVIAVPTYPMYRVCASIAGAKIEEVKRRQDFGIDADLLIRTANARKAKLMFICSPNNPDGSCTSLPEIERLLRGFEGIVVIDEAYFEFCGQTCRPLLKKYLNLIVIRTFSKAFALAGARIGYAISSKEIADRLNCVRPPSSISTASAMLAIDALDNPERMRKTVRQITAERKRVKQELEKLGFAVFPSAANFLAFRARSESDKERLFRKSMERGYILRDISSATDCRMCLRMTIRSRKENDLLLSTFSRCPDGLLFDMDGVLIDVSRSYREAIKQVVNAMCGEVVCDADIERIKGIPGSNNDWDVTYALAYGIKDLKRIDRTASEYTQVKEKFRELYLGGLRDLETPIAKIRMLKSLNACGYCLGIVTSRPREEAIYALEKLFPRVFNPNYIIALEDCDVEKPDPKPLILAKERMDCRNVIYIGDTINDALAAKAAGINFISVKRGLRVQSVIRNVNYIQEVLA